MDEIGSSSETASARLRDAVETEIECMVCETLSTQVVLDRHHGDLLKAPVGWCEFLNQINIPRHEFHPRVVCLPFGYVSHV